VNTTHHRNGICIEDRSLDGSEQSLIIDVHVTLQSVLNVPEIPELLKHNLRGWTPWQQRSGATIEQAILASDLAPQWIVALLAWGAHVGHATNDRHSIPLADYMRSPGSSHGRPTQLLIPINPPDRKWGEAFVGRTPSDQPIVLAIAVVDMDEVGVRLARVALTGVWREIARLAEAPQQLTGKPLTEKNILQVVEAIQNEVEPQNNWLGGAEYRRSMAGLMTRRAFKQCMAGEKGQ
jgi:carbon-monoxide dehydrogenase medium subunit